MVSTENATANRFSHAQLLIAALFAVVFTGEMPDVNFPVEGTVEPLDQEFSEIFADRRQVASRLARVSLTFVPDNPRYYENRLRLMRALIRTPLLPSAIARATAEDLSETTGDCSADEYLSRGAKLSLHAPQGVVPRVSRKCSVEPSFVRSIWERQLEFDEAWHRCRAELLKIRAERQGVQR